MSILYPMRRRNHTEQLVHAENEDKKYVYIYGFNPQRLPIHVN